MGEKSGGTFNPESLERLSGSKKVEYGGGIVKKDGGNKNTEMGEEIGLQK